MDRRNDTSRQLLFGLLALQTGLIDQAALVAAFHAWTQEKARPLADHLIILGRLDATHRPLLEGLAEAHLAGHGGDPEKSLAAIPAGISTREKLARVGDADVEASLAHLRPDSTQAGSDGDRTATYSVGTATSDGQRFRVLRPHARGGLGAVFVALDEELHREVALKQIQDRHADDPVSRHRFVVEAEITGGLEHPGIVPVYGLGSYGNGRPYYAMRFIRGDSLKEAIDRFHADEHLKKDTGRRSLEVRKLLRRFLDVCNAIDYAHSRGVLHRDIKPGNVIVGKHGETLVVDWGLAKATGKSEPGTEERTLTPSSASGSSETLPGSALGTPAYMSPEQARGDLDALGPRSDVYSLGATLYYLLTGKPPQEGEDIGELLRRSQRGEFPPPRQIEPSIDRMLETICLKAMALKPEDRYASPRLVADEIEHWMADEPVAAYPERLLERGARWLRRHRTLTYGAAAALAGITLVTTIALFVLNDARRREADARGEAESNFKMALEAVDNYLTNVSENRLLKEQDTIDIRTLRQDLLKSALPFYEKFVHQRKKDPKLQEQLANAHFRLGDITRVIGSSQDALRYYQSAQNLWDQLASTDSANLEFQSRLADSDVAIGRLIGSENLPESLDWLKRALKIYREIASRKPADPRFPSKLGTCCSDVALCLSKRKEIDESLEYLNEARNIFERLIKSHPNQIEQKLDLAETINRIGFLDFTRRDYPGALEHYKEFQKLSQDILDAVKGPKPLKIQDQLALSYFNIAVMYRDRAESERSLEASGKAVEHWSRLVEVAPSVTSYKVDLGRAYFSRAWTQQQIDRDSDAQASADQALAIYKRLIDDEPENIDHQADRADVLNFKGAVFYEARKNDPALRIFQEVLDLRRSILRRTSGIDRRKVDLCVALQNLAETYLYKGDVAKGISLRDEEIGLRRELSAAHQEDRGYAVDLVDAYVGIGDTRRLSGDPQGAGDSYDQAKTIIEPLLAAHPNDGELQGKLARALERKANSLDDLEKSEAALDLLREAVKFAREALKAKASLGKPAEVLSEALWNLARLLRSRGDEQGARQMDRERSNLWKDRPAAELVDLAKLQAARAEEIGPNGMQPSKLSKRVRKLDLDQAAESIKLAIKLGVGDITKLKNNPGIAPIIEREDVKPLLQPPHTSDKPTGK
jgi:serine/threonine-protein kinase